MIILGPGVNISEWEADLQIELVKRGRLGQVFHDIDGIRPIINPTPPISLDFETHSKFTQAQGAYDAKLVQWVEGEIEAKGLMARTMTIIVKSPNSPSMSAKQLVNLLA